MTEYIKRIEVLHPCGDTLKVMVRKLQKAIRRTTFFNPTPIEHQRIWYYRELNVHSFHDCVFQALEVTFPKDLHQLVLEHPHVSSDGRLAYTQNDEKGEKGIQTVTTVGRYLKRHFPNLPDHEIRGLSTTKSGCRIVKSMEEMQDALMRGPKSCMKWRREEKNPYLSYCPTLGWGMAINEVNGEIEGRALVHFPTMRFVRTYRREGNNVTACEILQYWLKEAGFRHAKGWKDGTKLLNLEELAPYLDGDNIRARDEGKFWVLDDEDGDCTLNNTDGSYEPREGEVLGHCDCCDEDVYESDENRIWIGYGEDTLICGSCSNEFTEAYGRGESSYYIHRGNVICIGDTDYHKGYLRDQQELRQLHDGEYVHEDDCFYCEVMEQYYSNEEESSVVLEDGRTAADRNAWQCEESNKWYGDDEAHIEVDGCTVHPDHVPEANNETLPKEENESYEEHA